MASATMGWAGATVRSDQGWVRVKVGLGLGLGLGLGGWDSVEGWENEEGRKVCLGQLQAKSTNNTLVKGHLLINGRNLSGL